MLKSIKLENLLGKNIEINLNREATIISGEIGSGKTTILANIHSKLADDNCKPFNCDKVALVKEYEKYTPFFIPATCKINKKILDSLLLDMNEEVILNYSDFKNYFFKFSLDEIKEIFNGECNKKISAGENKLCFMLVKLLTSLNKVNPVVLADLPETYLTNDLIRNIPDAYLEINPKSQLIITSNHYEITRKLQLSNIVQID